MLSEDYREAEFAFGYSRSMGDFTPGVGFSRFVIDEDEDDTYYYSEYFFSLSYDGWEHVTPSLEYVHINFITTTR